MSAAVDIAFKKASRIRNHTRVLRRIVVEMATNHPDRGSMLKRIDRLEVALLDMLEESMGRGPACRPSASSTSTAPTH